MKCLNLNYGTVCNVPSVCFPFSTEYCTDGTVEKGWTWSNFDYKCTNIHTKGDHTDGHKKDMTLHNGAIGP